MTIAASSQQPAASSQQPAASSQQPAASSQQPALDKQPRKSSPSRKFSYGHLSKEELVALLQKRDAARKLGLVWERDEIEHERALNDDFVALELDTSLSVGDPPYSNVLIEGDNFDALRYLHIAFKGRVKCIYIDPPYNTGNKDFVYNDRFLDKEDSYRHSKWLEFMFRRLLLSRDLLSPDGVILISINDENRAKLELLCDQVFTGMRIGTFAWKTRSGSNDETGKQFSMDHEHILVYGNRNFTFRGLEKDFGQYKNPDKDKRGRWKTGDLTKSHTYLERPKAFYPIQNDKTGVWYPCNPSRVWAFASEHRLEKATKLRAKTMEQYIREDKVIFPDPATERVVVWNTKAELLDAIRRNDVPLRPKNQTPLITEDLPDLDFWIGKPVGFGRPWFKRHLCDLQSDVRPVSSWIKGASDDDNDDLTVQLITQRSGTGEHSVNEILGFNAFSFPKPPSLLLNLLRQTTAPGDIVLDFFAGSGTTGHAILALNHEEMDALPRKFVMVSNSEATQQNPARNLCRDVCQARMKAVIKGYNNTAGLGGSFAYMRVQRIPRETLAIDIRHDQIWFALQQMHANAVSPYQSDDPVQTLDDAAANYDILYVSSLSRPAMAFLGKRFGTSRKPCIVYSWQPGVIRQRFQEGHVTIEKIPEYLIERFGKVEA